ncbi:MAG: hypothetical protein WCP18_00825 [bacterium]
MKKVFVEVPGGKAKREQHRFGGEKTTNLNSLYKRQLHQALANSRRRSQRLEAHRAQRNHDEVENDIIVVTPYVALNTLPFVSCCLTRSNKLILVREDGLKVAI